MKSLKDPGGSYSKHHRGETTPGKNAGILNIDHAQVEIQKALANVRMKPKIPGERLSKGARRSIRNAKALLRKNGMKVA